MVAEAEDQPAIEQGEHVAEPERIPDGTAEGGIAEGSHRRTESCIA